MGSKTPAPKGKIKGDLAVLLRPYFFLVKDLHFPRRTFFNPQIFVGIMEMDFVRDDLFLEISLRKLRNLSCLPPQLGHFHKIRRERSGHHPLKGKRIFRAHLGPRPFRRGLRSTRIRPIRVHLSTDLRCTGPPIQKRSAVEKVRCVPVKRGTDFSCGFGYGPEF